MILVIRRGTTPENGLNFKRGSLLSISSLTAAVSHPIFLRIVADFKPRPSKNATSFRPSSLSASFNGLLFVSVL